MSAQRTVSLTEAAGLLKIAKCTLYRRIAQGRIETRETGRAANGRPVREVVLASLPAWARHNIDTSRADAREPKAPRREAGGIPVTPDGLPDLAALVAMGRERHAREYRRRLRAASEVLRLLDTTDHGDRQAIWAEVAAECEVSVATLRRWSRTLQEEGPAALVPGWGATRANYRSLPDALQRAIQTTWLSRRQITLAQVMRYCVRPWCAQHGQPVPNRRTVSRYLDREIAHSEAIAARKGPKAWLAEIAVKVSRDPLTLAPNELWCADHRKLDVFVFGPDGRVVRPWVTAIVDLRSAAWVAWRMHTGPNARQVALALRDGILEWGLPQAFYTDNGKDFRARALAGAKGRRDAPSLEEMERLSRFPAELPWEVARNGLLDTLGIHTIVALPYHAWSKPIESMFGAFAGRHENSIQGWCGRNALDKPEILKRHIARGALLNWQQATDVWGSMVADWNREHVCGQRRWPPIEHYRDAQVRSVEPNALDLLLMRPEKPRKVPTQGLTICGRRYMSEDLAPYVGERVQVLYDPDDLRAVICVVPATGHRFAVPEMPTAPWTEFGEANRIAQRSRSAQRAALAETTARLAPHVNPAHQDPYGTTEMIAERQAAEAAAKRRALRAAADEGRALKAEMADARKHERDDRREALDSLRAGGREWYERQRRYAQLSRAEPGEGRQSA